MKPDPNKTEYPDFGKVTSDFADKVSAILQGLNSERYDPQDFEYIGDQSTNKDSDEILRVYRHTPTGLYFGRGIYGSPSFLYDWYLLEIETTMIKIQRFTISQNP